MSKIIAPVFSVFFSLCVLQSAKAQVFTGNITLNTQASVDAFSYTEVDGTLTIMGTGITNLNGLSELTKCKNLIISCRDLTSIIGLANLAEIELQLNIKDNRSLTNLDGFSSLTQVGGVTAGGIVIDNNEALLDIDGFISLKYTRQLEIIDNPALTNVEGISGITGFGFGDLIIENNDDLADLDGFQISNSFNGNIRIIGNASLVNVNGLSGIKNVEHNFSIIDNPSLTHLGLTNLTYIVLGGLVIRNNSSLTNLNGLENLDDVGSLSIVNNDALVTINALAHLNTIRSSLSIVDNDALVNLVGLTGLDFVYGNLNISDNGSLVSIGSLLNFTSIGDNLFIKNNDLLPSLAGLEKLEAVYENIEISGNEILTNFCALTKLFTTGTIVGTVSIINNGANTLSITPPADIILYNDPGVCSRDISAVVPAIATVTGCLKPSAPASSAYPPGNIFPVGTTEIIWTATDAAGNTATAVQKVIITDNELPKITCPGNLNLKCAADVPAVNINAVTATDNCSVTVAHVGDVITNQTCDNRFTLTRTYRATDGAGNTVECSQVITVNDDVVPQITGLSPSKSILWPPNHKMHDITLSYTAIDNCVTNLDPTITISSNEPENGTGDGDTDTDWEIIDDYTIRLRAERATNGTGRIYTITVTVDDGCNPPVTATTEVRVTHNITGPQSGNSFKVGSTVALIGEFWDVPGNIHSAKWLIDGSTTAKGIVTEPSGNKNGKVTGSYKFTAPGIYKLQMNTTDQKGVTTYANTNGDIDAIVVIYDPNGGHTYGGGYFNSPAGALINNSSATGKVSYGFAMNYFKNSTNPKGETQFEFKVGEFEFNALNFEYLVISNSMAQFKGTGKIIGGQSGIAFTMTVVDGQLDGSGIDKIRMKIYNKNNGKVIYDNQPGASDAALPTQAVGANSTIVINGNNSSDIITASTGSVSQTRIESMPFTIPGELKVMAYPNPSATFFSIRVETTENEKITMQLIDIQGRLIETRNVTPNSVITFGEKLIAGVYLVRVIQGKVHKELKLVKLLQ